MKRGLGLIETSFNGITSSTWRFSQNLTPSTEYTIVLKLRTFLSIAILLSLASCVHGEETAKTPTIMTNGLGMKLTQIAKASFQMGAISPERFQEINKGISDSNEKLDLLGLVPPQREMVIENDYWIGVHEVTQGQFREFVDATKYVTEAEKDGRGGTGLLDGGQFGQAPDFTWRDCGLQLTDEHPVLNVSWNDAIAFCKWLSTKEGAEYRLPSEAEWEYACRGGTVTPFFCGKDVASIEKYANVADASLAAKAPGLPWAAPFDDGIAYVAKIGQYQSNGYGLYDVYGNAQEWCADRFSFLQPLGREPEDDFVMRTIRGGNWFNDPFRGSSASRSGAPPEHRMSLIGFRVAMSEAK